MKLMRYNRSVEPATLARLGVLLPGDLVGDMRAGYARYLVEEKKDPQGREIATLRMQPHIAQLLAIGPPAWDAVTAAREYLHKISVGDPGATGLDGEPLVSPLIECRLHAVVKPSKVIAVGRNYAEHLKEAGIKLDMRVPSAWIKANNAIIGPTRDIVKPAATKELDYETELAIVIGKRCRDIPESRAYDVIAGYAVMNDISARDLVRIERKEGNQLLGKMFDGFAPLGPWLVTKDEIVDPQNLQIITRVNGAVRQNGNTCDMIWPIPKLIAYLSQMTLEAGDVISTGTPEGVALGRKPDLPSWFLNAGDILESEVENVGVLRNRIVDEPAIERSWKW
jgi:acylpyruvate hydrolase